MDGPIYLLSSALARALPYSFVAVSDEELPSTYFEVSVCTCGQAQCVEAERG
jgi:hypothetical protein